MKHSTKLLTSLVVALVLVSILPMVGGPAARVAADECGGTYTVCSGDTLSAIAQRFGTSVQTLVQLNAPPQLRGRVIGLYQTSALGMMTFSGFTVGFGASILGVHWALITSAAMLLALTAIIVPALLRSGHKTPA